jgi:hypothetical protein
VWDHCISRHVPRRELEATVVGRVYQPRLGQRAPEEGQLAQADRPGFTLHPSEVVSTGGAVYAWWALTRRAPRTAAMLEPQRRRAPIAAHCTILAFGRELYGGVDSAVRLQRSVCWPRSLLQKLENALRRRSSARWSSRCKNARM